MERQQEFVLRTLEERDIRFVRLWFTDVLGTLKSVSVAPAELESAFDEGIGFDGSAVEGFARVYESDMIAMITVLSAFALGYFIRLRVAAFLAYAVAYLWAFTFQTLYLLLDSLGEGAAAAFIPGTFPLDYGMVALGVLLAGLGLVELGHRVRTRVTGRAVRD